MILYFFGLILFALLVLAGAAWYVIRDMRRVVNREADKHFFGRVIIKRDGWVGYVGQKSQGLGRMLGRGALVLSPDEMYFILAWPRSEISIPTEDVRAATASREFLGRPFEETVLTITYVDGGEEDQIGLLVSEHEQWRSQILSAAKRAGAPV